MGESGAGDSVTGTAKARHAIPCLESTITTYQVACSRAEVKGALLACQVSSRAEVKGALLACQEANFPQDFGIRTTDNIFVLRSLIDKQRQSQYKGKAGKLYCCFVDFRKAFDLILYLVLCCGRHCKSLVSAG